MLLNASVTTIAVAAVAALLTACGGGGGGEVDRGSATTPTTPTTPVSLYLTNTDHSLFNYYNYSLAIKGLQDGAFSLNADILSKNDAVNPMLAGRTFDLARNVDLIYQNDTGFAGIYNHNGKTGKVVSDITLQLRISDLGAYDYVSDLKIGAENPIIIEGQNLGTLDGLAEFYVKLTSKGSFRDNKGLGVFSNVLYSSGTIEGAFSSNDTALGNPEYVAGEVKVRYGDYNDRDKNAFVGVFVAGADE